MKEIHSLLSLPLSFFVLVLIVVIGLLKWQQRQKVRAERRNAEARRQRPRHAGTAIRSPEYTKPTEQQENTYEKVRNVSAFSFNFTMNFASFADNRDENTRR